MAQPTLLTDAEVGTGLDRLPGWSGTTSGIERSYDFPAFLAGVQTVSEVATAAESMDHHPDIDIRWRTVHFACSTHSAGGLTSLDLELATKIHQLATAAGAT